MTISKSYGIVPNMSMFDGTEFQQKKNVQDACTLKYIIFMQNISNFKYVYIGPN